MKKTAVSYAVAAFAITTLVSAVALATHKDGQPHGGGGDKSNLQQQLGALEVRVEALEEVTSRTPKLRDAAGTLVWVGVGPRIVLEGQGGRLFWLEFDKRLVFFTDGLAFDEPDCQGNVFVRQEEEPQFFFLGIRNGSMNSGLVYLPVDPDAAPSTVFIESELTLDEICVNTGTSATLKPAVLVLDLNAEFVLPFAWGF